MPAADDLFRPTAPTRVEPKQSEEPEQAEQAQPSQAPQPAEPAAAPPAEAKPKQPSGRVRHDEKMTVYVTSSELHDLEHARLVLRSTHGLAVDRGRLVREAIAVVIADFEANADESVIVRRLRQE